VTHEIANGSGKELLAHAYYQLQRDVKAPDGESYMVSTFTGPAVFTDQEKFQKVNFADIEAGNAKFATKADNGWIAMIQHYFVAAWIPEPGLPREFYMRKLESSQNPAVAAGVIVPVPLAAPGSNGVAGGTGLRRTTDPVDAGATGETRRPTVASVRRVCRWSSTMAG
jgi:YidC/Oxa1 family membrane protein insertase